MMSRCNLILTTSPRSQPAKNPDRTPSLPLRQRPSYGRKRHSHTGKERDSETGLYYYGARYLDGKTSRWLSGDPAMGEYIPSAPVSDEARKRNGSLPGMGGVFNYVNLHVYHYAGNNPVKYSDPDGQTTRPLEESEWADVKKAIDYTVANLDSIINELTNYVSGASQSISGEIVQNASRWLGINVNSKTTARTFAEDLSKIKNKLESLNINDFSWSDEIGDRVALTNIQTEHTKLDPAFFDLPFEGGFTTQVGTMIHEVTHFSSVLNTRDITTGINSSRKLAANPSGMSYKNAYNWEFFFSGYVNERKKR